MLLFIDEASFENYLAVASVCVSGVVKVGETRLVTKWQRLKLSEVQWPRHVTWEVTDRAVMRLWTQIPTDGSCFHAATVIHGLQTSWQRLLAVSLRAFLLSFY